MRELFWAVVCCLAVVVVMVVVMMMVVVVVMVDAVVTDGVVLEKRVCVAAVRSGYCHVVADHRLRTLDDGVVSRGSVSSSAYICVQYRIYACAGTEERKTRSWPFKAVRLLNPTVGVSRLLTRAFTPPTVARIGGKLPLRPTRGPTGSPHQRVAPHPGTRVGELGESE